MDDAHATPNPQTDGLPAFIEHARKNQDAFPEVSPEAMRLLVEVEEMFQCFRPALNASSKIALTVLAVRCHSFYVTAASAAMACSTTEVHPLLRAALECAGYAAHLSLNPGLGEVWVARADRTNNAARKAVRSAFGHDKICKSVDRLDAEIGRAYREIYDAAIDLGAHPNVIGVMSSFAVSEQAGERTLDHHILTSDVKKVLHTASLVGQAGLISVQILRSVFPTASLTDQDFNLPVTRIMQLAKTIEALATAKMTPAD
jgi:hypothetical protein